jgi:hypothetical protein
MNSFIRTVCLVSACLLAVSCNRMVREEAYLSAESTEQLKPAGDQDLPRTSNNLAIPEVSATGGSVAPDSKPPEMAFARKRSEDENVVIIESQGMPTIELFNDQDAWQLMMGDHGYNWLVLEEDQDNCQVTLRFYDPITEEVESTNFFKRLFTLNSNYVDRSGDYLLTCLKLPQKQQIWLQTIDYEAPSSYVVDDLFSHIFDAATQ